jgi:hypothetical protein
MTSKLEDFIQRFDTNEEITEDDMRISLLQSAEEIGLTDGELHAALQAIPEIREKQRLRLAEAAFKAKESTRGFESAQARINRERAEKKAKEERLLDEHREATRKEIEDEVRRLNEQARENEVLRQQAEERRKKAEKEFEEWRKEQAASKEATEKAKKATADNAEAQRRSKLSTIIFKWESVLPEGNDDLKIARKLMRTSEECKRLKKALQEAGERFHEAARKIDEAFKKNNQRH